VRATGNDIYVLACKWGGPTREVQVKKSLERREASRQAFLTRQANAIGGKGFVTGSELAIRADRLSPERGRQSLRHKYSART
jgi:hypothetical protein